MEQAIVERAIAGCVYGDFSVFHVYLGDCSLRENCDRRVCVNAEKERPPDIGRRLAINMILNGVHLPNRGYDGLVSAAHTESDIDKTTQAFGNSLDTLVDEGALSN
jgi:glutamate-1-semialdehyde aminotransferase